jgi:hypothetical protein
MGGNCGHNTMALRIDGVLYVVESQSKGAEASMAAFRSLILRCFS